MERIKDLRKRSKLTQKELAQRLKISDSTLSYWERGDYEPDTGSLIALANFFDVSLDYLLGTTDDPAPPSKKKEATPPFGSEEWLREGLAARGYENLSKEQISFLLNNIDGIAAEFEKRISEDGKK